MRAFDAASAPLGDDQVGPPPEEFARRSRRRDPRCDRHVAAVEQFRAIRTGLRAEHHVERIHRRVQRRFEYRHRCADLSERTFGLPDLKPAAPLPYSRLMVDNRSCSVCT